MTELCFYHGGAMLLCTDWFREASKDFKNVIDLLSHVVNAGGDDLTIILTLANTSYWMGGTFLIIMQPTSKKLTQQLCGDKKITR